MLEGCAIYFEHPYATLSPEHRRAIIAYELHLRYFIQAQRWADFPFAFQTLGSAMAVRAETYCQVGGMNTRQAGEDFYFLHKVIERGHFADLTRACVYPSPRISWRVPFGTGRAMQTELEKNMTAKTYNPMIFRDLRTMIGCVTEFHVADAKDHNTVIAELPASMKEFFTTIDAEDKLKEIRENTASAAAFEKRFFRWFNAFRVMKYVHFARDRYYPKVELSAAVVWLCGQLGVEVSLDSEVEMLLAMRGLGKKSSRAYCFTYDRTD